MGPWQGFGWMDERFQVHGRQRGMNSNYRNYTTIFIPYSPRCWSLTNKGCWEPKISRLLSVNFSGESDVPLEICNTMQPHAWGYDRDNDVGHKTADEVMEMLAGTKEDERQLIAEHWSFAGWFSFCG